MSFFCIVETRIFNTTMVVEAGRVKRMEVAKRPISARHCVRATSRSCYRGEHNDAPFTVHVPIKGSEKVQVCEF